MSRNHITFPAVLLAALAVAALAKMEAAAPENGAAMRTTFDLELSQIGRASCRERV